ncbi:nuclear transport factor 2 family protein [Ekhidna sp.]|uniref:nuclear transport factor 2 family protein n=1 Tax=Ekhidna sp. TaxID=2608089 RepID=UPI0035115342
MKTTLITLSLLFMFSAIGQDMLSVAKEEETYEEREEIILSIMNDGAKQWYEGKPEGYVAAYAEDITYFDPGTNGKRIESKEELAIIFSERNTAATYEIIDPAFQHSKDFSVLTYQIIQEFNGITLQWNCTEVYAKVDENWSVIHGHFSPYSEEIAMLPKKILFLGGGVGAIVFLLVGILIGRRTKRK